MEVITRDAGLTELGDSVDSHIVGGVGSTFQCSQGCHLIVYLSLKRRQCLFQVSLAPLNGQRRHSGAIHF